MLRWRYTYQLNCLAVLDFCQKDMQVLQFSNY